MNSAASSIPASPERAEGSCRGERTGHGTLIRRGYARWFLISTIAVLCVLVNGNWKIDPDSVAYLLMARSFAAGYGLHRFGLHQWYYAPAYSVLISPAFWFGGRPFWIISIINVMTAAALLLGVWFWFKQYSRRGAALIAGLVGINCGLWDVCREPRADTLFSTLLIWGAAMLARTCRAKSRRQIFGCALTGGVVLAAACLTRQVGIFLAVGFFVVVIAGYFRGQFRRAHVLAAIVVALLATGAVASLSIHDHLAARLDRAGAPLSYWKQFREPGVSLGAQLLEGIRRQIADVGRLCIPGMWGSFAHRGQWLNINSIVYLAFVIPVAIGWWRLAWRTRDPLLWTMPFYAAMFIVWPFDQGTRFNVPMLPVMWAAVWSVLRRVPRWRATILSVVLFLHLLVGLVYLAHDVPIVAAENRPMPELVSLSGRISNAEPVAVSGTPWHVQWIECYLLDRPVRAIIPKDIQAKGWARWLIVPAGTRTPASFVVVGNSGDFKLCYRKSPAI